MFGIQSILLMITVILLFSIHQVAPLRSASYAPIFIRGKYKTEYQFLINSSAEYVFSYPTYSITSMETARIEVESNATYELPLIVIVQQKLGVLSWKIPLVVKSMYFNDLTYNKTSRTLCSNKYYRKENEEEFVIVTLWTGSQQNVLFKLNMSNEPYFYLRTGENISAEISPSKPIYYGYTFPKEGHGSSVVMHVKSDNDICMTVSIQNTSCPVFDLERNTESAGYWQTVSRQGAITIPKEVYPMGFFVVLVVKSDDTDCYGKPYMTPLRDKNIILQVHASVTQQDYITASLTIISLIFCFCSAYVVSVVLFKIKEGRRIKQELLHHDSEQIDEQLQSPSTVEETGPEQYVSVDEDSSLDEDDIDVLEDINSDKEMIRTKRVLSVCDLARKDPKILRHKSRLYLYYLLTVAVFYALPAIQLVVTYQHVLHVTGNQDMCYYNFLCSHPFGLISDYNHVVSNIGYIMLGLLFIFLAYSREHNVFDRERNKCYGIPQHYGLFYAMGAALIMEGVLSGSYHIINDNYYIIYLDSSFMYIISVLCMIKIYQTRHPDINARASATFGILALIIFIGLMGALNGSIYFWVIFCIVYLMTCLLLTIQIYYMGRSKCRGLLTRIIQNCKYDAHVGIRYLFRPLYPGRFIMLVIANLWNVGLAVVGNLRHHTEFATFLLAILMSNLILYTIFYIVMKVCHKEKILLQPLIYIILSIICWTAALYFFINKTTSWALTPAQSRLYNKPCRLLNFFDNHDIWHFLSALAMFFSFMVFLTLDDDLVDVHRSQIPVF